MQALHKLRKAADAYQKIFFKTWLLLNTRDNAHGILQPHHVGIQEGMLIILIPVLWVVPRLFRGVARKRRKKFVWALKKVRG